MYKQIAKNDSLSSSILKLWQFITALGALSIILIYLLSTADKFISEGPFSNITVTQLVLCLLWGKIYMVTKLINRGKVNQSNVLDVLFVSILSLLYLYILRETVSYGDMRDYLKAAQNLAANSTIHHRYLYPPFLAVVLKFFVVNGDAQPAFALLWTINYLSLIMFFFALKNILVKYDLPPNYSSLITFVFMLVNVPIMRTMIYGQINLLVISLVLYGVLFQEKSKVFSAILFSLAFHLKVSPLLLTLAFFRKQGLQWFLSFVIASAAILGLTILFCGSQPYIDFIHNIRNIYGANGIAYRDNSFDSVFRAIEYIFSLKSGFISSCIPFSKLLFSSLLAVTAYYAVKNHFFSRDSDTAFTYNALPLLFIFMTMNSPIVWEHHSVFMCVPYLLLINYLSSKRDWAIYGALYTLEFLVPVFDFFPWSYGRLVSPIILTVLIFQKSRGQCLPNRDFTVHIEESINKFIASLWSTPFIKAPSSTI